MASATGPTIQQSRFHHSKEEYGHNAIAKALERGQLTARDAALITEYITERQVSNNLGQSRSNKVTYALVAWRRFLGPYVENTMPDLYAGISALRAGTTYRGRPFTENGIHDQILFLKQFYLWLNENDYVALPEKKLQKIRAPTPNPVTKSAADLITPDEIIAMVRACTASRDRALIMTLYEGGLRIGEIGTLTWQQLRFDNVGVIATILYKTKKIRYVRLVMARDYLAQWRADYPFLAEGDALVFLNALNKPLRYNAAANHLRRIARRAGITRHLTPHIFRHARVTHLIRAGISESVVKLQIWGSQQTKQFQTYCHLTGHDIDKEILHHYGITPEADPDDIALTPVTCPHCQYINSPVSNHCRACGRSLTEEGVNDEETIRVFLRQHPEGLEAFFAEQVKQAVATQMGVPIADR